VWVRRALERHGGRALDDGRVLGPHHGLHAAAVALREVGLCVRAAGGEIDHDDVAADVLSRALDVEAGRLERIVVAAHAVLRP
jgi:hypothetical protein